MEEKDNLLNLCAELKKSDIKFYDDTVKHRIKKFLTYINKFIPFLTKQQLKSKIGQLPKESKRTKEQKQLIVTWRETYIPISYNYWYRSGPLYRILQSFIKYIDFNKGRKTIFKIRIGCLMTLQVFVNVLNILGFKEMFRTYTVKKIDYFTRNNPKKTESYYLEFIYRFNNKTKLGSIEKLWDEVEKNVCYDCFKLIYEFVFYQETRVIEKNKKNKMKISF